MTDDPDWYTMPYSWVTRATRTRTTPAEPILAITEGPLMESDAFRPLYFDILDYGLEYARQKYSLKLPEPVECAKTKNPKTVIVVGAGPAGLSAARELAQVGHEVKIIELQQRVGGRVKTLSEPFEKGLWSDSEYIDSTEVTYLKDNFSNIPQILPKPAVKLRTTACSL